MKLKLNLFVLFTAAALTLVKGQELDSISTEIEDGRVVVKYDFLEGEEGVDYELYLYGSHDNFTKPLQQTSGDVGKKVRIGRNKIIYWNAKKELGNFKGDFSLKIKGTKYVPFVTYQNIDKNLKIKRGETFDIKWKPSGRAEKILLKILRNGVPISDPLVVNNSGSYSWQIPSGLKPGKGYTVQIADTKNLIRKETSESFSVKRKFALAYKIVPAAIIAGAAVILLSNEENNGIPNPPGAPTDMR